MKFSNKVVVVTGGSSGIGAAAAKKFTQEGAQVVIVGRNEVKLQEVHEDCSKIGKEPMVIVADVSKDDDALRIIDNTIDKYKKIDVLVNNAGTVKFGTLLDGSIMKTYDEVFNVNLRAIVHLTSLASPHLVKTKGNVVNISSIGATISLKTPGNHLYSASKAGLNHFSRSAALELASYGVRVNIISPGPVITDIYANAGMNVSWDAAIPTTALKRISEPSEVADLIMFLASDDAKSITGSNYVLDNGVTILRS